ncbi:MAG: hypothetical protein HDT46_02090 [Ruminococcaceae bacterium]|nr:hypothetical protein [Oscillospiraceae bacterium]
MKRKFKIMVASALAAVCLAVPASAYFSIGSGVSYEVSTDYKKWNNKNTSSAWMLNSSSNCVFSATRTAGDGKATFTVYQWTTGNDYERGSWSSEYSLSKKGLTGNPVPGDDYYATVELTSGTSMKGKVTLAYES